MLIKIFISVVEAAMKGREGNLNLRAYLVNQLSSIPAQEVTSTVANLLIRAYDDELKYLTNAAEILAKRENQRLVFTKGGFVFNRLKATLHGKDCHGNVDLVGRCVGGAPEAHWGSVRVLVDMRTSSKPAELKRKRRMRAAMACEGLWQRISVEKEAEIGWACEEGVRDSKPAMILQWDLFSLSFTLRYTGSDGAVRCICSPPVTSVQDVVLCIAFAIVSTDEQRYQYALAAEGEISSGDEAPLHAEEEQECCEWEDLTPEEDVTCAGVGAGELRLAPKKWPGRRQPVFRARVVSNHRGRAVYVPLHVHAVRRNGVMPCVLKEYKDPAEAWSEIRSRWGSGNTESACHTLLAQNVYQVPFVKRSIMDN